MGMTNTQKQFSGAVGLLYMIFDNAIETCKEKTISVAEKGRIGFRNMTLSKDVGHHPLIFKCE